MSERAAVALKRWRKLAGLTQHAAATLVGVDQPTLSHWEAGRREPGIGEAIRLEEVSEGKVPIRIWRQSERRSPAAKRTGTEG